MKNFVNQYSEIGKLNTVMLHRPNIEIDQVTPEFFNEMLIDDTLYLPAAQCDHDVFAGILRDNGTQVLFLSELFCDVIADDAIRLRYIDEYVRESAIGGEDIRTAVQEYLRPMPPQELFRAVSKGIRSADLEHISPKSVTLSIRDPYPFVLDPMPNIYFTRDTSICIGSGMVICSMSKPARRRETLFTRYIHDFHPLFKDSPLWYDNTIPYNIEGGDVLILSDKVLAIGCGERTSIAAVEMLADKLFAEGYERILVFNNPKSRKFMHLDVLCTMVDYDKFLTHPCIYDKQFDVYELTGKPGALRISITTDPVDRIFARALGLPSVRFVEMGGGDPIIAAREHWNMGSNSLTIAPGNVIVYDRNEVTNELLARAGVKVNTVPAAELVRGRGGPRCMSMAINRDNLR
jgi:arginine deiminase